MQPQLPGLRVPKHVPGANQRPPVRGHSSCHGFGLPRASTATNHGLPWASRRALDSRAKSSRRRRRQLVLSRTQGRASQEGRAGEAGNASPGMSTRSEGQVLGPCCGDPSVASAPRRPRSRQLVSRDSQHRGVRAGCPPSQFRVLCFVALGVGRLDFDSIYYLRTLARSGCPLPRSMTRKTTRLASITS
jgi:hypothetical protein